jgi:uncharacterized repeat protein (TIGR03803 family)
VFSLRPPATVCVAVQCPWTHTVLHKFTGSPDGANPVYGNLIFDSQNNMYGTTNGGGPGNGGTVFQLTQSGGSWTESVLFGFDEGADRPFNSVIFDSAGNLYGTASEGGSDGFGAVYELTKSGSNWTYSDLHDFTFEDGTTPEGGLIFDAAGNLYSTTALGLSGGTAFELLPSGGGWTIDVLQDLTGGVPGPLAGLTLDSAGNLYGTNSTGVAHNNGYVFKLTYSGGVWNYSTLYSFTGGADGGNPLGSLILDANGDIFGVSSCSVGGCDGGSGAVWEIVQ